MVGHTGCGCADVNVDWTPLADGDPSIWGGAAPEAPPGGCYKVRRQDGGRPVSTSRRCNGAKKPSLKGGNSVGTSTWAGLSRRWMWTGAPPGQ